MKPFRIKMAHQLIVNYGLYREMNVYQPHRATYAEMKRFHSPEYIEYLNKIIPSTEESNFNIGFNDCPVFDGLYEFSQISSGASIDAACLLNSKVSDIAINWAGGLHHAKKCEASGFCYVNDIVLGILELLKYHERVLYIDIDVHHGDGVEEAFYLTNRVMTLSLHKFGDFFPGTGSIKDTGEEVGKNFAMNVPLKAGMTDEMYVDLFKAIAGNVKDRYRPTAVVIQCGADSISWDRLGPFCLTIQGHGECLDYVKSWGIPLMVLGGGGYTVKNVSRCWTYETAVCLGQHNEISSQLPANDYYEYYGPDYDLFIPKKNEPNQNSPEYINYIISKCLQNLKDQEGAPNVPFMDVPPDFFDSEEIEKKNQVNMSKYDVEEQEDTPKLHYNFEYYFYCIDHRKSHNDSDDE